MHNDEARKEGRGTERKLAIPWKKDNTWEGIVRHSTCVLPFVQAYYSSSALD